MMIGEKKSLGLFLQCLLPLLLSFCGLTEQSLRTECPRGLFLLKRPTSPASPPSPYDTPASGNSCVLNCPAGFFPIINFTNSPSFSDLNSGTKERQAILKCAACPSECTVCFGPKTESQCYVCPHGWQGNGTAVRPTSDAKRPPSAKNLQGCKRWKKLQKLGSQRSHNRNGHALGTAIICVLIAAVFSAVLIFSAYRLRWERKHSHESANSTSCVFIPWDWVKAFARRKKYTTLSTIDGAERALWRKEGDESSVLTSHEVKIRGSRGTENVTLLTPGEISEFGQRMEAVPRLSESDRDF